MASYICKCGRVVKKSTTADNTGNRDTAGCEGCPYLLPWGPMIFGTNYDGTKGYHMEIHGYECRMSPSLEYATYYQGNGTDKCVLHIYSLDYDFLERLSTWVAEQFPEKEISCSFDRSKIRATEFVGGLYGISVYPMQNKKGIAAKAALLHQFFDNSGARLDMTPEEEEAHILSAIEVGKAAYQRKKENMRYTISENLENDCVYAYAAKEFWVYDKQACRWYTSRFCREQYERAKQKLSRLTPEDFLTDSSDYGLLDDYEISSAALNALQEAVKSGKREAAPFEGTNPPTPAAADASPCAPGASDVPPSPSQSAAADVQQGGGDDTANPTYSAAAASSGPEEPVAGTAEPADLPEVCRGCRCATCGNEDCPTPCHQKSDEVEECEQLGPMGDDCEDYQPKEDAECLKTPAPNGDVAAITAANAATKPSRVAETTTTSENGADVNGFPNALTAPQPAEGCADIATNAPSSLPAFDYTGLDDQTVADLHLAGREIRNGRKMAEMGLQRMADGVAIAHDALCGSYDKLSQLKHGNRGENTFGAWCESLGLHRKAAYRLLQVSRLFDDSTPREQKALRELTNSVLYEASRPSAEPEAVEALKRQQVKTLKEFRALEAQIKAERQAREKAEHDAQRYREDSEKAREAAHTYHCQYEQANQQRNALLDQQTEYISRIEAAEKDKAAAQRRADVAEKERDGARQALRGTRKQEEKWREKAQTVQAQLDQLQAQPIPSTAIDMDELERRVAERMEAERAKHPSEDPERSQQDSRDAYDAFILATRSIDNIWKTLRPQVGRLGALQGNAKNMLLQQLMKVKEELIHECENRQSGS